MKDIGGWEQQLGEDTDVSLRMIKAGWKLRFAPDAVARTECPNKMRQVMRQRFRWDRGGMRAFFKKHYRLLDPRVAGFWFAFELFTEFFFAVVATLIYPIYLVWMFWINWPVAVFALVTANIFYSLLSALSVAAGRDLHATHREALGAARGVVPQPGLQGDPALGAHPCHGVRAVAHPLRGHVPADVGVGARQALLSGQPCRRRAR